MRLVSRLRTCFLAGVLVTAPIFLTLYTAWVTVSLIDAWVGQLFPSGYRPSEVLPVTVPGIGVLIVLGAITLIGWFAAGYLGRLVIRLGEGLVDRMPIVRNIYGALKQIFETVLAKQSTAFREVVLVEYPRLGLWSLAFITGPTHGQIQSLTQHEVVNVFISTTPNPTSGYLLFVPRKDLVTLDMTVEEGLKMVVSGGIVLPPDRSRRGGAGRAAAVAVPVPVAEGRLPMATEPGGDR